MRRIVDIDMDVGETNHLNQYKESVEMLSSLIEENLKTEAFRILWVLTVLNARIEGHDSADIESLRKSLTGLAQYTKSSQLTVFIEGNGESVISYGRSKIGLSPFVIEHKYIRKGREKGIVIGWIIRDLKTVENLVTKLERLEKSEGVWIDRHKSIEAEKTEVLVAKTDVNRPSKKVHRESNIED